MKKYEVRVYFYDEIEAVDEEHAWVILCDNISEGVYDKYVILDEIDTDEE